MVSENHFLQQPRKNTHGKQVHRCTEYVTFPALLAYLPDFISYVHRFRGSLYKLLHHVDIQAFFARSLLYICIASDLVPVFVQFRELHTYNLLEPFNGLFSMKTAHKTDNFPSSCPTLARKLPLSLRLQEKSYVYFERKVLQDDPLSCRTATFLSQVTLHT